MQFPLEILLFALYCVERQMCWLQKKITSELKMSCYICIRIGTRIQAIEPAVACMNDNDNGITNYTRGCSFCSSRSVF